MVQPKKKKNPSQIYNLDDDDDMEEDYNEVIRPKVIRKPPLTEDSYLFVIFMVKKG